MKLTELEERTIDLLLAGKARWEIADILGVSPRTVKSTICRAGRRNGIFGEQYHVAVRLVYLTAVESGLIFPLEEPCLEQF